MLTAVVLVTVITAAAVLAAKQDASPVKKDTDKLFNDAYCKVLECSEPGTVMPKVLLGGLDACKKAHGACFDIFSICTKGIANTLGLSQKDEENDYGYDLESLKDPFLAKVRSAIIRYSSSRLSGMTGTKLLELPPTSTWRFSSGFYCK